MKKFLTFVLVLAMVMSVSSVAMAADLPAVADGKITLADGQTYNLTGDVTLDAGQTIEIPAGAKVVIDLYGNTITGTDNTTGSYGLIKINPGAELTISDSVGGGKIILTAINNRGWDGYSSVISNQRGKLTVNGGTIEHLGGTDMAYGIDNLTNGAGTYAETVINGGTIKSTYRAIRQFLNGAGTAQNILTVNGGTIEGANKSIWMQDPNANANPGTLIVSEKANLKGDVYLSVTAGSTEWPVSVSIDSDALDGESQVLTNDNVPADSQVKETEGYWGIVDDDSVAVTKGMGYPTVDDAVNAADDGDTITLLTDASASGVNTDGKDLTIVDKNGVEHAVKDGVSISPATLDFGTKEAGYSGVDPQVITIEGAVGTPTVTLPTADASKYTYKVEVVTGATNKYTVTISPVDGLGAGNHDTSVTLNVASATNGTPYDVEPVKVFFTVTAPTSSGGYYGPDVWYIGGNTFGTNTNQVPTSVEIDQVPVSFTMNGGQITVDCITPGAKWVKVSWGSTTNTRYFTPDANAYCAQAVIPKTGGMSFWAAIAQFLGF